MKTLKDYIQQVLAEEATPLSMATKVDEASDPYSAVKVRNLLVKNFGGRSFMSLGSNPYASSQELTGSIPKDKVNDAEAALQSQGWVPAKNVVNDPNFKQFEREGSSTHVAIRNDGMFWVRGPKKAKAFTTSLYDSMESIGVDEADGHPDVKEAADATLVEGMWVIKSQDGVEKRFKKKDSPEAIAWAASRQLKPVKPKVDRQAQKEAAINVAGMALISADSWGEMDQTDIIAHKIVPAMVRAYNQNPDAYSDHFYQALKSATNRTWGSFDGVIKYLDLGAKAHGYRSFAAYAKEMESYTGGLDENTEDQAYLDQREADYKADAGPAAEQGEYVHYGRRYQTYVFGTAEEANAFMSENSGWGMIGYDRLGKIHLAKMDDEGDVNEAILDEADLASTVVVIGLDPEEGQVWIIRCDSRKTAKSFMLWDDPHGMKDFVIKRDHPKAFKRRILTADMMAQVQEHGRYSYDYDLDVDQYIRKVGAANWDRLRQRPMREDDSSVITKDQAQDFKDDILAKDEDGNEYDKAYLDQLRRRAGLK